jgi:uncharacterized OsmC-like protein
VDDGGVTGAMSSALTRSGALKPLLDAVADSVTLNPPQSLVRLRAECDLVGAYEVETRTTTGHAICCDEPASIGGRGAGPNPLELLLAAVGSCWLITCRMWATRGEIPLDSVSIDVRTTFDIGGLLGVDGAPVAPDTVHLRVTLAGPADPTTYERLVEQVTAHSPVGVLVGHGVDISTEVAVAARSGPVDADRRSNLS